MPKITRKSNNQAKKSGVRTTKKPVARQRLQTSPSRTGQFLLENARFIVMLLSAVALGVLLFFGYRSATASAVFQIQKVDIAGTRRASNQAIELVARRMTQKSGIWNADLDVIRREVERLPWVKSAVVSRVLPDGIRVRVSERTPRAVIRAESGKLVWVDDEAQVLGAVLKDETSPPFVMLGWNESNTETARKNNQERVQLYLKLVNEWQEQELAKQITAVDLAELEDVSVYIEKDSVLIPVYLGEKDFSARLRLAFESIEQHAAGGRLAEIEKIFVRGDYAVVAYKKQPGANESTPRKKGKTTVR